MQRMNQNITRPWTKWIAVVTFAIWAGACGKTDAGITTAIKAKLAADDTVKAFQIDVDTRDKTVTLSGVVDTAEAKTRAAEIARLQDGVSQVIDNLTVTAAGPPPMTDADLNTAVKSKLLTNTAVSAEKINIETVDGVVTLSGEVRSEAEKDIVVRLARETGVRDVNDRLIVVPR
jgi:hyperosmotically inducible protein